jgi:transposase
MYVKRAWNTYKGKRYERFYLVESYRDPKSGKVRQRHLANLNRLPPQAIDAVREALRTGKGPIKASELEINTGDTLRGAGLLAIYGAWQREGMSRVLGGLSHAERESALAMIAQRILEPGSKLSLKEQFSDTVVGRTLSRKRLDEDELYRVMDALHEEFYMIQERLRSLRPSAPLLCLYDITSTYFEGTKAEEGEYGYSRDKRWDRYQIVIGLVCDEEGLPLAIEVWPGNTADRSTVGDRVKVLKERFGIERAVFVGDKGMYSEANVEELEAAGFEYILGTEWHTQRRQLEALEPWQLELFDQQGVVEWEEKGVRYVGCVSEQRHKRAARRREEGIEVARQELGELSEKAVRGRYYSWVRLREKVNEILSRAGVQGLWEVEISCAEGETGSPEDKRRLRLSFQPDEEAVVRQAALEGKYVLRTSLPTSLYSGEEVDGHYRRLQQAERAFRHIKSYLKIRPIYHYRRRRVRAHVLICFLGFYLVKRMELELRAAGETREVERVLRYWDKLRLVQQEARLGEYTHREWQWSLGEVGKGIRAHLEALGWWRWVDGYRRRLVKNLAW